MADTRLGDPGTRGTLGFTPRSVEHLAMIAAGEVDGVVRSSSVLGHRYPKADATIAGQRVRVALDIAIAWPLPLATVTAAVRQRVREQISGLTDLTVDAVDVTASKIVHAPAPDTRRVQ